MRILLLGGSGFVGRAVAEQLTRQGYAVTVPTRHRERAKHLLVLPNCELVETNIHDNTILKSLISQHDVVINLIGILCGDYEQAHVKLPERIAMLCVECGVTRLIHISALNADPNGASAYLQSRGRGEAAIRAVAVTAPQLHLTILQPSVIYGENDHFLNVFARLIVRFPLILLGTPQARFQPVWVEDVARAVIVSIDQPATFGKTYELGGPKIYTLAQLLDFVIALSGKSRTVIGLSPSLSMLQAVIFEFPPGKWLMSWFGAVLTRDAVRSMRSPNICKQEFPPVLGFKPAAMEGIVINYMRGGMGRARYQLLRNRAGRWNEPEEPIER